MQQRHVPQQSVVQPHVLVAAPGPGLDIAGRSTPSNAPCRKAGAFLFQRKQKEVHHV